MREISKSAVVPAQFNEYVQKESIPNRRIDEHTFRFEVPDSLARRPGKVIYTVDAVHQGDGIWSTSTSLVRVPKKDSSELSAILRAGLDARGRTTSRAGLLLANDMLIVGGEGPVASPRDLIGHVKDAADTASQIFPAILHKADELGYRFDWTVCDGRRR
jgi:hypothetical protein